uniref:Vomeronasal type-1 receptor n=1 Tax=Chinchilla lanigera TaxID=34839 RepID=A0A8C2US27_CHILA
MSKHKELFSNINIRITFYSEVGIGVSGNAILLLFHIAVLLLGHRHRLTDLPVDLLALNHLVMLVIEGYIGTDLFTTQGRVWDDITCKSLIFLYRCTRGLSICITCQLSVLQAIILSPRSSCLAKFKHKSSWHNMCPILFLWVLYTSVSSHLVISITATPNLTRDHHMYVTQSCSVLPMHSFLRHVFSPLLICREAFFTVFMCLSGGYIVILLWRHKNSPELKAARTILLHMSFFVVMSILDSTISYSRTMFNDNAVLHCIQVLMARSYATVSPLVFITTEKRMISFLRSM